MVTKKFVSILLCKQITTFTEQLSSNFQRTEGCSKWENAASYNKLFDVTIVLKHLTHGFLIAKLNPCGFNLTATGLIGLR